jgi:hypothetical protein
MMTDDELLSRAAPLTDDQLSGLDLGPAPRPVSHRRKRWAVAGAGLAVAVAAVGVPAAAGEFTARTGVPASGGEEGTSERIRLDAPDVGDVYQQYIDEHELPPGGTWDAFRARMAEVPADSAVVPEEIVAQWVAWEARCQWERAWVHHVPGAQAVIDDLQTWPEFTGPHDAGGLGEQLLRDLAAQTRVGDDHLLTQDLRANC